MLTKLYKVFYEGFSASDVDQLRTDRKWGLPGVNCSVCGETWAQTGVAYPSVDLSILSNEEEYRRGRGRPVAVDELEQRRQGLRNLIREELVLPPGTELGPLVGIGRGTFTDFVWMNPWTLLAQPQVLERLRAAGVKLPVSVPALIEFKQANIQGLLELDLEPRSTVDPSSMPAEASNRCPGCGRVPVQMPARIVIQGSSIPSDVDIFRDRLITTLILAKERFVEAVKSLKLTGLQFQEVDLS